MRVSATVLAVVCLLAPAPALAYENFIPLGHNYSPEDPSLPPLNSAQDKVSAQVDIYESEIYVRQRAAKEFQSNLDHFYYGQELRGGSPFIDY